MDTFSSVSVAAATATADTKTAYLEVVPEELVIELRNLELIGLFPVHDPSTALALRINQDRIPGSSGHHDAILYTQVICR